jgi:DNA-binding MarR family transcriptional regulator
VAKKKPMLRFETLSGRSKDIVTRLTNSIALQDSDCCTVDNFAEEFETTPGRLKTTLQRLEEAGLIKLTGEETQLVVPTVKLLHHQDRHLTARKAQDLIRQYKKGQYE